MKRKFLITTVVAAVLITWAEPSLAMRATTRQTSARYEFNSSRDGQLLVTGRITADPQHRGMLATVAVEGNHAYLPQVVEFGGKPQDGTYGRVGANPLCPSELQCQWSADQQVLTFTQNFEIDGDGRHSTHVRFYLVAQGATVTVRDQLLSGWKASHRARGYEQLLATAVATAGMSAAGYDTEVATDYSARGSGKGSVAIATPPCDQAGTGLVTLNNSNNQSVTEACPTQGLASVSTRATVWRVSGLATGVSTRQTRLLIIDA